MFIPHRLKDIRMARGLTQKQLAEKVGLGVNSIARYETGQRKPNIDAIYKLANALEVDWVIFDDTKNEYDSNFNFAKSSDNEKRNFADKLRESSEDFNTVFNKIIREERAKSWQELLLMAFNCLNEKGKYEAVKNVARLASQEKYITPDSSTASEHEEEKE